MVARLSFSGYIHSVYVVFNMFPKTDNGVARMQYSREDWRVPPNPEGEQFSCAGIGNCLGGFGWDVGLQWTDKNRASSRAPQGRHGIERHPPAHYRG